MNKYLKGSLIFTVGLGIGAVSGIIFEKKRSDGKLQQEISKMEEYFKETHEKGSSGPYKGDEETVDNSSTDSDETRQNGSMEAREASGGEIKPFSSDGGEESLAKRYSKLLQRVDYGNLNGGVDYGEIDENMGIEIDPSQATMVDAKVEGSGGNSDNDAGSEDKPWYDFPDEDERAAPYLISYEDFGEKVEKVGNHIFDSGLVASYYKLEGVLLDDDTDENLDIVDYLGETVDPMNSAELGSRFYVRNEKMMKDYEVIVRGTRDTDY